MFQRAGSGQAAKRQSGKGAERQRGKAAKRQRGGAAAVLRFDGKAGGAQGLGRRGAGFWLGRWWW